MYVYYYVKLRRTENREQKDKTNQIIKKRTDLLICIAI